ncbi:hypothetical protein [Lysobacter soli]|uniref:hypothetical protein n=1 Tax=Lysobacter soli TaxID=453783 RepID=UPI00240EEDA3|nr:hypothetical protein [Lysobacter soli]MDG2519341.1 hypothetical protein [Lysobacter soli]
MDALISADVNGLPGGAGRFHGGCFGAMLLTFQTGVRAGVARGGVMAMMNFGHRVLLR